MRLITDEQHAQIVEALNSCSGNCEHLHHAKKDRHSIGEDCPVEARYSKALATLQALPEVVQAVDTNNGDFEGDVYISRSAGWIDDYFKRYSTLKLYATKETS